jgi:hypothetical protein
LAGLTSSPHSPKNARIASEKQAATREAELQTPYEGSLDKQDSKEAAAGGDVKTRVVPVLV